MKISFVGSESGAGFFTIISSLGYMHIQLFTEWTKNQRIAQHWCKGMEEDVKRRQ